MLPLGIVVSLDLKSQATELQRNSRSWQPSQHQRTLSGDACGPIVIKQADNGVSTNHCLLFPIRPTVGFLFSRFHLLSCIHRGLLFSLNNSQIQLCFFVMRRASQFLEIGMNVSLSRQRSGFFCLFFFLRTRIYGHC